MLAIIILAALGAGDFTPPRAPWQPTGGAPALMASSLAREYMANAVRASSEREGKVVELFGAVDSIRQDTITGAPIVNITTILLGRPIEARFSDASAPAIAKLDEGQLIAVRGTVTHGLLRGPALSDCRLIWSGVSPADPRGAPSALEGAWLAQSAAVCVNSYVSNPKIQAAFTAAGESSLTDLIPAMARLSDAATKALGSVRPMDCITPSVGALLGCAAAKFAHTSEAVADECELGELGAAMPEAKRLINAVKAAARKGKRK